MPLEMHMSSDATKYTVEPSGTCCCWKIHRNGEPITVQNAQATPMLQAATELNRLASERDALAADLEKCKAPNEHANSVIEKAVERTTTASDGTRLRYYVAADGEALKAEIERLMGVCNWWGGNYQSWVEATKKAEAQRDAAVAFFREFRQHVEGAAKPWRAILATWAAAEAVADSAPTPAPTVNAELLAACKRAYELLARGDASAITEAAQAVGARDILRTAIASAEKVGAR